MAEGLYSIAPGESPQSVELRRKIALGLLNEGTSTAPIRSGWQGAANLAKALMGGYDLYKADQSEASGREQANKQFMEGIGAIQGADPSAAPTAQPQASRPPQPPMIPGYNGEPARPKVASSATVMGDDEGIRNGTYEGSPSPAAGTPGVPMPRPNPMRSPVASALAGPPAAPAPAPATPRQQISPALLAALGNPYLPPGHSSVASHLVTNALSPEKQTFQTLPNGDILALDPSGRMQPRVVYNAPKSPTMVSMEDDREYYNRDPVSGKLSPIERPGGARPQQGIPLPDGTTLTPPEGVDRKEWKKETSKTIADAQTGKMTESQAKDYKFAQKMELAEKTLSGIDFSKSGWTGPATMYGKVMEGSDWVPGSRMLGNQAQSNDYQKYRAARDLFLSGLLRDESGAAIGERSEFPREERNYFPQPGDAPSVIKQKAEARKVATEAMKKGVGLPAIFVGGKQIAGPPAGQPAPQGDGGWTYNGIKQ